MSEWRNRIVGEGEEAPDQLLAHDKNWRIHPKAQQDALAAVLDQVGFVQRIIVNQRTGKVVDGHLRVAMAISKEQPKVPVVYVDLDEAEEALILATIDPLSALAATDSEKLDELLEEVGRDNSAIAQIFAKPDDPSEHWQGMPEFHQDDLTAYKQLKVNFANQSSYEEFSRLVNQTLTDKTRSIWYPAAEIGTYADKQYTDAT